MLAAIRISLIAGLWMLSTAMIAVRTVINDNPGLAVLSTWSINVALVASIITGWHLLIRERHQIETIATLAAATALEEQSLSLVD